MSSDDDAVPWPVASTLDLAVEDGCMSFRDALCIVIECRAEGGWQHFKRKVRARCGGRLNPDVAGALISFDARMANLGGGNV